jgi:hypothetical protein
MWPHLEATSAGLRADLSDAHKRAGRSLIRRWHSSPWPTERAAALSRAERAEAQAAEAEQGARIALGTVETLRWAAARRRGGWWRGSGRRGGRSDLGPEAPRATLDARGA